MLCVDRVFVWVCAYVVQKSLSRDLIYFICFFQAEDGIRDLVRSRGLGDVYKRQRKTRPEMRGASGALSNNSIAAEASRTITANHARTCLLYTSDAADERSSVDLGGRRIIKKKKMRVAVDGQTGKVDTAHTRRQESTQKTE